MHAAAAARPSIVKRVCGVGPLMIGVYTLSFEFLERLGPGRAEGLHLGWEIVIASRRLVVRLQS